MLGGLCRLYLHRTSRLEYNLQCFDCFLQKAISFKIFIIKPFGRLFFRQFITHIYQELDLLIIHRAIQRHTQPMSFVHVPAGEDARFLPERADQSGIAFEIHHTDFTLAGKFQILSGDIHDHGKPLSVEFVTM